MKLMNFWLREFGLKAHFSVQWGQEQITGSWQMHGSIYEAVPAGARPSSLWPRMQPCSRLARACPFNHLTSFPTSFPTLSPLFPSCLKYNCPNPYSLFCFLFVCLFLRLHMQHLEVPQLLAYTTATEMLNPSPICDLHCSLQEHWILNPLSEVRDWTCITMDASGVLNLLSHSGNSLQYFFKERIWWSQGMKSK